MNTIELPHHHHSPETEQHIIQNIPKDNTITAVSNAFNQLGDPTRLKIFWLLCHTEECVIDISALMGMSSPAISHHLRVLKSAGLLSTRRNGKEMYYKAANTSIVKKLHKIIEELAEIQCLN